MTGFARIDGIPLLWLGLGAALIAAANMRWGVGSLAWIAWVPLLRWQRLRGRRILGRDLLGASILYVALCVGWTLAVLKIITEPLPLVFAPLFSIPIAALQLPALRLHHRFRDRLGTTGGPLLFASTMVLVEFVQHQFTPFGSWGAAAYTQREHLTLLQLASVTGMAGVSFLVYWTSAQLEELLDSGWSRNRRPMWVLVAALLSISAAGSVRLHGSDNEGHDTALVAAVDTDATFGGLPLPSPQELDAINAGLHERTRQAASAGAKLVSWTEGSTLVLPVDEEAFLERTGALAAETGVELVAAYIVPLPGDTFHYGNRYAWFRPDGTMDHRYDKRHPVFGEPATPGVQPASLVSTEVGRATGAICYDYDFPSMGQEHSRLGADLAVVPSSDWRGIDPIHTQMAALRSIEGGHSMLRATRMGLSAGVDPYGRVRGWRSHFEQGSKILLVRLPRSGVRTVYGLFGNWFLWICTMFVGGSILYVGSASRRG